MVRIPTNFFHNSIKLFGPKGVKWLIIGLVASIGIALVELSVSIVIQLLLVSFGFLSSQPKINYLKFLPLPLPIYIVTLILCVTAGIRFLVQLTSTQTAAFIRDYVSQRLRQNSISQMLYSDCPESRISSSINFKISEIFVKSAEFVFNATLFLSMFMQSSFLFLIMFLVAWKESFIALFGVFLIGTSVILINKKVSKYAKQVPYEQKKLNEGIEKIARNFIFIKLMKKRNEEHISINEAISEYSSKSIRANFFSNFGAQMGPFLGILLLVCVILLSQGLWHTQPLILISFIYLLARFVQSLSILSGYLGNVIIFLPQYRLALNSISQQSFDDNEHKIADNEISLFGVRNKTQLTPEPQITAKEKIHALLKSPSIAFREMNFGYPQSKMMFEKLNLEIQAGTQVGIIGGSGTGKSTLLMLITGILKPISGAVLIDNQKAHEYTADKDIRIGYVGAEPFLIRGTLKDNLCYGVSSPVSEEEIVQVLKMVSLENLIEEKGLGYIISEDHSGISAGQKQRVCLARAILNKPSLLILDEATANLDELNEKHVAQILNNLKGQCTTIIVSHRAGILAYADRIIEMNTLYGAFISEAPLKL